MKSSKNSISLFFLFFFSLNNSNDNRVVKVRLAEKDKECRWLTSESQRKDTLIQDQTNEIKELSTLVGGNSLELAKQAEEARRANLLSEEVK